MPRKVITKPSTAKRPRSGPNWVNLGIQASARIDTPRMPWRTTPDSVTKICAPASAPRIAPSVNGSSVPRSTKRQRIATRLDDEPSMTTVCTGIRMAGGNQIAITASRISPPAVPMVDAMNALTKQNAVSPPNTQPSTPGTPRKDASMLSMMKHEGGRVRCGPAHLPAEDQSRRNADITHPVPQFVMPGLAPGMTTKGRRPRRQVDGATAARHDGGCSRSDRQLQAGSGPVGESRRATHEGRPPDAQSCRGDCIGGVCRRQRDSVRRWGALQLRRQIRGGGVRSGHRWGKAAPGPWRRRKSETPI